MRSSTPPFSPSNHTHTHTPAGTPTGNEANYSAPTHTADHRKLAELIKGSRAAMLMTFLPDGHTRPHIRPMYTQQVDPETFNGDLWFMSDSDSAKVREIGDDHRVALTYAVPDKNRYIAVYGVATCERNPEKARALWNIHAKGWWPGGPDDPNLTLVRVRVESAEYWDGPSSVSYMLSLLKAVATNRQIELNTDHGKID